MMTIARAAKLIEQRKISPVELVDRCLKRIASLDGTYHAFIEVLAESAQAEALKAEKEIMAGHYKGPMHGIPIGLKDIYETRGVRTTGHSKVCADHIPETDATTTHLLAQAGAINLGKLSTWEFAIGGPSFDLPWPPAVNPWNAAHDPGGSSSGTGAAVGLGMVLGGMGSDTGGSIRFPAAMCGIAGIKPTYGRVSRAGVLPLAFSLDHTGPMAWTAEDCALMLQPVAGHDPRDPASADVPVADYTAGLNGNLKGLRVGVLRQFYERDSVADADVIAALDEAVTVLKSLGAEVVEAPPLSPFGDYISAAFIMSRSESYAVHEETFKANPNLFGSLARQRILPGALFSAADYIQAMRRRRELVNELAVAMQSVDLLVLPSVATAAPRLEDMTPHFNVTRPMYTTPFNLTGSPAMSVCSGFSAAGLPLSLQIVGRPFDEATVLRAGDAYERATEWRGRLPDAVMAAA
ncbi:hypothetical protein ASB57_29170 [Bordetella sp. N]|nr:hypothetical protein ASB57_29170 [Bordetella sp. N]